MSRVKAHPKAKQHKAYKLNRAEREMSQRGKTVAIGTVVALLVIVVALFLYVQLG